MMFDINDNQSNTGSEYLVLDQYIIQFVVNEVNF